MLHLAEARTRTERDVASNCVWLLRSKGLIPKVVMSDALRALDLTPDDLMAAGRRAERLGEAALRPRYSPLPEGEPSAPSPPAPSTNGDDSSPRTPPPAPGTPPDPPADPFPDPSPYPVRGDGSKSDVPPTNPPEKSRRRERREIDGVVHLLCAGCDEWLPEETSFLMRSDRNARVSRCRKCRKQYQRQRYVSTQVIDELGVIGLRFEVGEDSNLIGLVCSGCNGPIIEHDIVVGSVAPIHERCSVSGGS